MRLCRPLFALSWLLLAAGIAGCAQPPSPAAAPARLVPEARRITDEAIARDRQVFAAQLRRQERLAAEPSAALAPAAYALAKARCWLQAGEGQYVRNDRSSFPDEALREAVALLDAVEGGKVIPGRTPRINGAIRLREDLWERAEQLKSHPGLACGAAELACAEVALVWGGDQQAKFGVSAVQEHGERAEEWIGRAAHAIHACTLQPGEPDESSLTEAVPVEGAVISHPVR